MITDCNDGTFSRMDDFLREMECLNCVIDNNNADLQMEPINYERVIPRLEAYIARSKNTLQMILSGKEEKQ